MVKGTKHPGPGAHFVDGLTSGAGRDALRDGRVRASRRADRGVACCSGPLLIAALAVVADSSSSRCVAIFVDVGPGELISSLDDPVAVDALKLSLLTTGVALGIILLVGTPAAWLFGARRVSGAARPILTLIELPLILPPAAAGIGLLAALGPHGLLGHQLEAFGIVLPLSTAGVVVALVFVSSPFFIRQAQAAFGALDESLARGVAHAGRIGGAHVRACRASRSRCPRWAPAPRSPGAGRWASSARR